MIRINLFGFTFIAFTIVIAVAGCVNANTDNAEKLPDETVTVITDKDTIISESQKVVNKAAGFQTTNPDSVIAFAKTLIGVPYLYASIDPAKGFDCSGFITYVFNHFNITVPRSSADFTNYGETITIEEAKPGDLILFTGTDSTIRVVGHMGIVEKVEEGKLYFIHSTSGKGKGVVITPFEKYYQSRFIKVIRVFADEFFNKSSGL